MTVTKVMYILDQMIADGWSKGQVKKKAESDTADDQHVALADAIASWRHGILTIGTLGLDPLKHFNQLSEIQVLSNEQDENEDNFDEYSSVEICIEGVNGDQDPLVQHAAKHGFSSSSRCDYNGLPPFNVHDQEPKIMYTSVDHVAANNSNNYHLEIDKKRIIEGERVTLADLFSADCEEFSGAKPRNHGDNAKVVMIQTEDQHGHVIKKTDEATISPSAKMPVPQLKKDSHSSRPIKKINRVSQVIHANNVVLHNNLFRYVTLTMKH